MPDNITLTINGVEYVPVPVELLREVREDVADYTGFISDHWRYSDEDRREVDARVDALDALLPDAPPVIEPVDSGWKWPWPEEITSWTWLRDDDVLTELHNMPMQMIRIRDYDKTTRGPLGDVTGLQGTPERPLWIVRHPDDGPLTIDARNHEFALRLKNCKHLRFYGFNVIANHGDGIDILEGCEDIEFHHVRVNGGKVGFMANQTSGNVIRDIRLYHCMATNQRENNFYFSGVFGKSWGFSDCIGAHNQGKTDRCQIFYVSAMNSRPFARRCSAIDGPMTGMQFRSGVDAEGLLVADCATGVLLGGLDGFEPEEFIKTKTALLRDSVIVRSKEQIGGQYWNKGIEVKFCGAALHKVFLAEHYTGVEASGLYKYNHVITTGVSGDATFYGVVKHGSYSGADYLLEHREPTGNIVELGHAVSAIASTPITHEPCRDWHAGVMRASGLEG